MANKYIYIIIRLFDTVPQVYEMIKPRLRIPEDVTSFIEGHIQIDLQHIAACCGESTEDCILLIHELLQRISKGIRIWQQIILLNLVLVIVHLLLYCHLISKSFSSKLLPIIGVNK